MKITAAFTFVLSLALLFQTTHANAISLPRLRELILPRATPHEQLRSQDRRFEISDVDANLKKYFGTEEKSYKNIDLLAEVILKEPPEVREKYITKTYQIYRDLTKKQTPGEQKPNRAPRRLADRLLYQLHRADLIIAAHIENGLSGRAALESYFQEVTRYSNAKYNFGHVYEVLKSLQSQLREVTESEGVEYITAGGSFFNGRADVKTSDVDLNVPKSKRSAFYWPEGSVTDLNAIFRDLGGATSLKYEAHNFPEPFFNMLQPLVFKITRDSITLEVFTKPPLNESRIGGLESADRRPVISFEL